MFICVFLCSPSVGYVKYIYIYIYHGVIIPPANCGTRCIIPACFHFWTWIIVFRISSQSVAFMAYFIARGIQCDMFYSQITKLIFLIQFIPCFELSYWHWFQFMCIVNPNRRCSADLISTVENTHPVFSINSK